MKKYKLVLFTMLVCNLNILAQKVDTLYYDNNWKGVETKQFASFIRYVSYAQDGNYRNKFLTYFNTGELNSEGDFISIDKYDDSKSEFGAWKSYYKNGKLQTDWDVVDGKGKCINYYENGNKKEEFELVNGTQNGIAISYFENGLIHTKGDCVNGKYNGIFYQFTEKGDACSQAEYKNGEPAKPYYTYSTQDGFVAKYKMSDGTLYLEMPSINEKQVYHQKGDTWDYYMKNGLCLMVNASINKDYGKYFTLYVVLTNNSVQPITFNPALITAYKKKKDKVKNLNVLNSDEYMAKVSRRQNWGSFFNALNESMAASKAGYSASSTQTNSSYSGATVSGAVGAAVGTNGATVGAAVGVSGYAGSLSTSSTTVGYNGAAAYQAELIASGRIAEYNNQMLQERQMKDEGYLKITTVNPGETITGYVNIQYEKGDELSINIPIDSVVYPFVWDISK